MNINELPSRLPSANPSADRSSTTRTGEAMRGGNVEEVKLGLLPLKDTVLPKDRVELTRKEEQWIDNELPFARKAILGIPPLSQERVAEILERLQTRYYEQPAITREIAQRVSETITLADLGFSAGVDFTADQA